jgi:hypothetical protein
MVASLCNRQWNAMAVNASQLCHVTWSFVMRCVLVEGV